MTAFAPNPNGQTVATSFPANGVIFDWSRTKLFVPMYWTDAADMVVIATAYRADQKARWSVLLTSYAIVKPEIIKADVGKRLLNLL